MQKNKTISVLGQSINNITLKETLAIATKAIKDDKSLAIATVNPEFLVLATRNKQFSSTLSTFDIRVPDGIGILYLTNIFTRNRFKERVAGVELSEKLIEFCAHKGYKVALIGGSAKANKKACKNLLAKYPSLALYGSSAEIIDPSNPPPKLLAELASFKPQLTLVALGAPKQEYFIRTLEKGIKSVFIGVGGTVDFIAGAARRAPLFVRKIGLEWLWRLFCEPRRFKRIINATIVFPAYYIKNILKQKINP